MKKQLKSIIQIAFLALGFAGFSNVAKDSLIFAPFGEVHLYVPQATIESVSIMISGDAGWKYGILDFSDHFAENNSLIIGVDILLYYKSLKSRKDKCYDIATDFVTLATSIEKKYRLPYYQEPVLMGYSSGATMVYALLAQARPGAFQGGISVGFCPDVELPKHFCELNGLKQHAITLGKGFDLNPDSRLGNRWIVLNGKLDNICTFQKTFDFIAKCSDAELVPLEKVGHGFGNWKDYMPQWDTAFLSLLGAKKKPTASTGDQDKGNIGDLPVTVTEATSNGDGKPLVLFISGDGGWYSFEQNLADRMAKSGLTTIGLDAKKYFWNQRTPEETATDMTKLLYHYLKVYKNDKILLMGYSMGADILPFVFNIFPDDIKQGIKSIVVLSPDAKADFEIHVTDMLGLGNRSDTYDVIGALRTASFGTKVVVVTGSHENSTLPSKLVKTAIQFVTVPGDHHYNKDTEAVFDVINSTMLTK